MRRISRLFYGVTSHLPAARWCFAVIVIAFTAVVSVHKYIDMADTASFSCLEVIYLILTDTMNIVFIYLPLYLFVVSGIMFDSGFGEIAVLRYSDRSEWLSVKLAAYIVNTLVFFFMTVLLNFAVSFRVFNFSELWSGDFIGFRVMAGQSASDFAHSPVITIASASFAVFMLYVFCGTVNMLFSLVSDRESAGLFASLVAGVLLGIADMLITTESLASQINRIVVLAAACVLVCFIARAVVIKKNFGGKKLY